MAITDTLGLSGLVTGEVGELVTQFTTILTAAIPVSFGLFAVWKGVGIVKGML